MRTNKIRPGKERFEKQGNINIEKSGGFVHHLQNSELTVSSFFFYTEKEFV